MSDNENIPSSGRSPAFPFIDLRAAIDYAEILYQKISRDWADLKRISEIIGISCSSNNFRQTISTLRYFGIIQTHGSKNRLTKDALDIVLDDQKSFNRLVLLRKLALLPHIHREIYEKYHHSLPCDELFKNYLIMELNFNPVGANKLITIYKNTVTFCSLFDVDTSEHRDISDDGYQEYIKGPNFVLKVKGEFGQNKMAQLIKILEMHQDDFP